MVWLNEFADRTISNAPLAPLTWFRLGGPARHLVSPRDARDLARLLRFARQENVPFRLLGHGANVLVGDQGVPGIVVRLNQGMFRQTYFDDTRVSVGAGVDLMRLCRSCCERGLGVLEGLAGIPGSVGGAVKMNAGGRFGQFGDAVACATVLTRDGVTEVRNRKQLGLGYRRSNLDGATVLSVDLELTHDDPKELTDRYREIWALKRGSQPVADKSAGCIFKNPTGYSAGALIDRAGLKGISSGGARVSERHANFIIAEARARAIDVLRLVDEIRDRVRTSFGIELELEVEVW